MGFRYFVAGGCALLLASSIAISDIAAQQQVLRAGAHLVLVDAYPVSASGTDARPTPGLTAADFDVFEDGTLQTIDFVRFMEFPTWTPESARRDPNNQRESFELAADPANRLFVVYLNRVKWQHGNQVQPALFSFLDRTMGPRDYVAIMTAMQGPGDIVFGQLTSAFKGEIQRFLDIVDPVDPKFMDPTELEIFACFPEDWPALLGRWRADDLYRDLEGVVSLLGSIRETRSTLIFVSENMFDPADLPTLTKLDQGKTRILPPVMLTPPPGGRGTFQVPGKEIQHNRCDDLRKAASGPWDPDRFKKLVARARTANVSLNSINPRGLFASANPEAITYATRVDELMRTMANETGGLAMVTTNDMGEAFRRISDEHSSHYVIGYYSSNRNADGRIRRITVKRKASGETIRARREYRAPTAAEAAPSTPSANAATGPKPVTPDAVRQALFDLENHERAAQSDAPPRAAAAGMAVWSHAPSPPAAPWRPVTIRRFARTQRIRLQWTAVPDAARPLPAAVRLLDRQGRALPAAFTLTRPDGGLSLDATMALAPLAVGLYVVEAEMPDGTRQYVAFRVE
jgi:VWFA-related protein